MEDFKEFGNSLKLLGRQAHDAYNPLINSIIESRSKDENEIEHILDGLLGFCFDPDCLLLFRKMCRYYWTLNQAATANQINAYREMWDSEDENLDEEKGLDIGV